MSGSDYDWLVETHQAVIKYSSVELAGMTRRVIFALQRMPATGIYGDEPTFKSVWDEYCYEVQYGPSEDLEWAWDETISTFVMDQIDRLPAHVRLLISIGAEYERGDSCTTTLGFDAQLVHDEAKAHLDRFASGRNLDHFLDY